MAEFFGNLALAAGVRAGGRTALTAQSFRAPYHLSKPYWDPETRTLLVQVVNSTAGILAGDRLESEITVNPGAALLVTTPSASRVFRMRGGAAACHQHFAVAAGGWLEVLPEPLVPHAGCRYRQTVQIDVAAEGGLFFADFLMPGRLAHAEAWSWDHLCLETEVVAGGELVLRERFAPDGADLRELAEMAGSGAKACFGNALLIADGGTGWLPEISALHGDGVWLGVSPLRRGGWSIKYVATDGIQVRRTLQALRRILAPHFPHLACSPRKL